jgi:peptide/nickel transport system substrate-binding protein
LTARLNALQSGQLDLIQLSADQYPRAQAMEKTGNFKIEAYSGIIDFELFLNAKTPGLDKPEVRQAINYAIDRQSIDDGIMNGQCPATTQQFGPGVPGHAADVENNYKYDPDKAKQLLAAAGVTNLNLNFVQPGVLPHSQIAAAVQAQLEKVGIHLTIQASGQPATAILDYRQGKYAGIVFNVSTLYPDVSYVIRDFYTGVNNPAGPGVLPPGFVDAAAKAKNLPLGSSERDQAYQDLTRMLAQQPLNAPICVAKALWIGSSKVIGMDQLSGTRSVFGTADTRLVSIAK